MSDTSSSGPAGSSPASATASPRWAAAREAPRTLGVPSLVFMVIAASAPLTVVAGGVPTSFAVTGVVGMPLIFVLLGVCLSLFAVGYAAMSTAIHNSGAFYAYVAQGLGRGAGVGAAWVALLSYNAIQVAIYGLFGFTAASFLDVMYGVMIPWWLPAVVAFLFVGWLGIRKIDLSALVLGILVTLEFAAVAVFMGVALTNAPDGASLAAVQPSSVLVPGFGAAVCFSVAAFMGFESAAIYSEETRNPRKSIARATFVAVAIISLFYAVAVWTLTVATGPGSIIASSREYGPDLVFVFLTQHGGPLVSITAQVLFLTSLLAALISFHNLVARYTFTLAREGILPALLATVDGPNRVPVAGSLSQSGLALALLAVFATAGVGSELGPLYPVLTFFTWLSNTAALGLVFLLTLVSVSCIGYFRRHPSAFSLWTRLFAPALSTVALGTLVVLVVINFEVLIEGAGPNALSWILPALVIVTWVAGTLWGRHLRSARPDVYAGIGLGRAHGVAEPDAGDGPDHPRPRPTRTPRG